MFRTVDGKWTCSSCVSSVNNCSRITETEIHDNFATTTHSSANAEKWFDLHEFRNSDRFSPKEVDAFFAQFELKESYNWNYWKIHEYKENTGENVLNCHHNHAIGRLIGLTMPLMTSTANLKQKKTDTHTTGNETMANCFCASQTQKQVNRTHKDIEWPSQPNRPIL